MKAVGWLRLKYSNTCQNGVKETLEGRKHLTKTISKTKRDPAKGLIKVGIKTGLDCKHAANKEIAVEVSYGSNFIRALGHKSK